MALETILVGMIIPFVSVYAYFTNHETLFKILSVVSIIELLFVFSLLVNLNKRFVLLFLMAVASIEALTFYFTKNTFANKLLLGISFCGCTITALYFIAASMNLNFH
ncbi:MAG: hypothetical protein J5875_10975 [Paludibacteraceae bacterium]|nr:hypothetical protein [Paludibacteraceae bacterium]